MTVLRFDKLELPGSPLGGLSTIPPLSDMKNIQNRRQAELDEDDELFLGYGSLGHTLPYLHQDRYARELEKMVFGTAVLENDFLKVVFIPSLGGRLWQLYDKRENRDLLYTNDCFRPCNLALRNAWFSGGIEWNIGMAGHTPFTCSPLFTAVLDGETPVLRMYEYERIRNVTYQMDFFLPETSPRLHCRMRIVNSSDSVVPMYWWSNIAVPEHEKSRVIVPAEEAYTHENNAVTKILMRGSPEQDFCYPVNNRDAKDYFFHIRSGRRYICQVDENGYGLLQTSSQRLRGRKLFVWGQGAGGRRWQQYLTEKMGPYDEIQCGLAKTQYECLPMPPHTAWEWIETYGPMQIEKTAAHGDFKAAMAAVEGYVDRQRLGTDALDTLLAQTRHTVALKEARLVSRGSGYGALENLRRRANAEKPLPKHLKFDVIDSEQEPWMQLLSSDAPDFPPPGAPPSSYMIADDWKIRLEKAADSGQRSWWVFLQLGVIAYSKAEYEEAERMFSLSLAEAETCTSLVCLANTAMKLGEYQKTEEWAVRAIRIDPGDVCAVRDMMKLLTACGAYPAVLTVFREQYHERLADAKCRYYVARAYLETGDVGRAELMLHENGGLEIPDIREGETLTTDLWFQIQQKKAASNGEGFDCRRTSPPLQFDFRMSIS